MNEIPVFFDVRQVATRNFSASPSAGKPLDVVKSWREREFPIGIYPVQPLTAEEISIAHSPSFVEDVLACRALNGFGNRLPEVASTLPWTNGSFYSALRHVLTHPEVKVAASPTSGFHHAEYDNSQGFCTFNGLAIALLLARRQGLLQHADKVGILDLDEHYGNGTDDILDRVRAENVVHYTYGNEDYVRGHGEKFLQDLGLVLMTKFRDCRVVLFQAGADPHEESNYSRGILSTDQLYRRDKIVFEALKRYGVPIVWNLAGGYSQPLRKVLDIHDNTMRACVETYIEPSL